MTHEQLREEYNDWFHKTRNPIGEGFPATTEQVSVWWLSKLDAYAEESYTNGANSLLAKEIVKIEVDKVLVKIAEKIEKLKKENEYKKIYEDDYDEISDYRKNEKIDVYNKSLSDSASLVREAMTKKI